MHDIYKGHKNLAEMVNGHLRNFRAGLLALKAVAEARYDSDDASYWGHEVKALGEIEVAVSHELQHAPQLLADLTDAAAQLRKYETLHRAKGAPDSLEKADVNATLAARFEATIAAAVGGALVQCCKPTAEEEALLASGEYRPEELWGGSRPTCPKCFKG